MNFRLKRCAFMLAFAALASLASTAAAAQEQHHVVSSGELRQDAAQPAQTRHANEQAVRSLLSSDAGQKALKSSGVDYQKVDRAVGQLNDEDLGKLARRSQQAQSDFAAGRLSDRDLLWIILIIVAVLIVALAVR
jgi:hypothetical protein